MNGANLMSDVAALAEISWDVTVPCMSEQKSEWTVPYIFALLFLKKKRFSSTLYPFWCLCCTWVALEMIYQKKNYLH